MNVTFGHNVSHPSHTALEYYRLSVSIASVISNLTIFALLLTEKSLRNTLTVYLTFLSGMNVLLNLIIQPIFTFYIDLMGLPPLHTLLCGIFAYCNMVINGLSLHCHALITLNRLWATLFPVSFRNTHTDRVALAMCGFAILYENALFFPGFITDLLYLPAGTLCDFQETYIPGWEILCTVQLGLPVLVIVLGYFTVIARLSQLKASAKKHKEKQTSGVLTTKGDLARKPSLRNRPFAILTATSLNVAITWIPYLAFSISPAPPRSITAMAVEVLVQLQSALDPVLLLVFSKDTRNALRSKIFCGKPQKKHVGATSRSFTVQNDSGDNNHP